MTLRTRWTVFYVLIAVFILGTLANHRLPASPAPESDPLLPSDQPVLVVRHRLACHDDEVLTRIQGYKDEHDDAAFLSAVSSDLTRGECLILKVGTPVFFEDRRFISGLVQVRVQGSTSLWWVQPSALKEGE